jgi:DNA-binding response OmpR family regulator
MEKRRILLVDDSARRRQRLMDLLANQPIEVIEATSCEEALERLATGDIPLILTETELPGKSGLFLLRKIKEKRSELEVILITHNDSSTNLMQALRLGACDFIFPPIDSGEILFSTIDRAFGRIENRIRANRKAMELEGDNLTLRHALKRANALVEAMEHLARVDEAETLLTEMLDQAMRELQMARGFIVLFERVNGQLGLKVGKGIAPEVCRKLSARIPSGLILEMSQRGKAVLVPGAYPAKLRALAAPEELQHLVVEPGLLAAPLFLKGRTVGMVILSQALGDEPTTTELQFLSRLYSFGAVLLEKAGVIHQLRRGKQGAGSPSV